VRMSFFYRERLDHAADRFHFRSARRRRSRSAAG
jgi:hypothetical protein